MAEDNYIPCGDEWKKEVMKMTKKDIVEMLARVCLELKETKRQLKVINSYTITD